MTIKLILQSPHFTAEQNKEAMQTCTKNVAAIPIIGDTVKLEQTKHLSLTWIVSSVLWEEKDDSLLPIITVTGLKTTGEINESL